MKLQQPCYRFSTVGGFNRSEYLQSVEAYDPTRNRWRDVAPMFTARGNFGAAMVDDLLFVMGGYDGFRVTTKEECYDAETGSWYRTQDMCTAKKAFSCCVVPASYSIIQPHHFLMVIQEEIHPSAPNSCCNVATQWKYQA